ncbi:MAG TPA: AAA family ATPase [Methylomirabilota bacterium]|nr:AAA family ATPase [Methylomirabilota bacterium]
MFGKSSLEKGEACYRKGQYDDALKFLTDALDEKSGDRTRCQYFLGLTWFEKGDYDKAIENLKGALELAPDRPVVPQDPAGAQYTLARAFYRKNDYASAAMWAEQGLRKDPRSPRLHNLLGIARLSLGNHEEAVTCCDRALELDPTHQAYPDTPGVIHDNKASALIGLKRYREALAAVDEAIRLEPRNGKYYNRRGLIFGDHLKDYEEGIKNIKKAIDLDPGNRDGVYYYNIAFFLTQQKRYEEASVFIQKALSLNAQDQSFVNLQKTIAQNVKADAELSMLTPRFTFADVGGMKELKAEIRRVMNVVLVEKEKARKYKIEKNGILLYGPPGCGKTFLAEAIAGEFKLSFLRVSVSAIVSKWIGESAQNIGKVFQDAIVHAPCLIFFDEFEAIASRRGEVAMHIEDQRTVDAFLQELDKYRRIPGIIVGAATNNLDALDKAVIREGRFDYKIKIYKPDFEARLEVFKAKLRNRPIAEDIDYFALANGTEGFATARIADVINNAALAALEADAPISSGHLQRALQAEVGKERFEGKRKTWDDLILDERTKEKLRFIENIIEHPEEARALGVEPPSGLLLCGPPGTGKTTVARVLASEVNASFYLVTPADVLSKWVGESEQRVRDLFEKARENRPSIVFVDEIDALLSRRDDGGGGQWRNMVVNAFLMEMDGLSSAPGVFVVGATNRPDLLDEAILRPGRLSERIEIPLPSAEQRRELLRLFTKKMKLGEDVDFGVLAGETEGFSGAEIEGLCNNAGRDALIRVLESKAAPAVVSADFVKALTERREGKKQQDKPIGFITKS